MKSPQASMLAALCALAVPLAAAASPTQLPRGADLDVLCAYDSRANSFREPDALKAFAAALVGVGQMHRFGEGDGSLAWVPEGTPNIVDSYDQPLSGLVRFRVKTAFTEQGWAEARPQSAQTMRDGVCAASIAEQRQSAAQEEQFQSLLSGVLSKLDNGEQPTRDEMGRLAVGYQQRAGMPGLDEKYRRAVTGYVTNIRGGGQELIQDDRRIIAAANFEGEGVDGMPAELASAVQARLEEQRRIREKLEADRVAKAKADDAAARERVASILAGDRRREEREAQAAADAATAQAAECRRLNGLLQQTCGHLQAPPDSSNNIAYGSWVLRHKRAWEDAGCDTFTTNIAQECS